MPVMVVEACCFLLHILLASQVTLESCQELRDFSLSQAGVSSSTKFKPVRAVVPELSQGFQGP